MKDGEDEEIGGRDVPDWDAIAAQVMRTMCVSAGERVVLMGNPEAFPGAFEAVRMSLLRCGAIHHATLPSWTGRLSTMRTSIGTNPDLGRAGLEVRAFYELLCTADVLMWLPEDFWGVGSTSGLSEWALARWRGRGFHLHWMLDLLLPPHDPVQRIIEKVLQHGILDLDYDAHRDLQQRVAAAIRGRRVQITTPDGTDLQVDFAPDCWFHFNNGISNREKQLSAVCARDREEELPCGMLRMIPRVDSVTGVVQYRRGQGIGLGAAAPDGLAWASFTKDLAFRFESGHIVEVRGGERDAQLQALWRAQTGDFDRLSEIIIGTNPLLPAGPAPGGKLPVNYGAGAGSVRLHLGDNTEMGGTCESSLSLHLFNSDATVLADGMSVVQDGRLVIE